MSEATTTTASVTVEMVTRTALLPVGALIAFTEQFRKAEKKALRAGLPAPTMRSTPAGTRQVPVYLDGMETVHRRTQRVHEVTITTPGIITVDGVTWGLLAVIEVLEGGNVVFDLQDHGEDFRNVEAGRCDHCRTNRRRKRLVALRSAAGEVRVIGASCSAAYIGTDLSAVLAMAEALNLAVDIDTRGAGEEDDMPRRGARNTFDTLEVASAAALIIAADREYRRADLDDSSTKARTLNLLLGRTVTGLGPERLKAVVDAEAAIEWAASKTNPDAFDANLAAVARATTIRFDKVGGLACYLVEAYRRHLAREEEERKAPTWGDGVKSRGPLTARVVELEEREYQWTGDVVMTVTAETADGLRIEWTTGSDCPRVGELAEGRATVKRYRRDGDRWTTVINRWAWSLVAE